MWNQWLVITTFSWFGSASLQYINTGGPGSDVGFDVMEGSNFPVPNMNYNSPPIKTDFSNLQMDPLIEQFYRRDDVIPEIQRKRRSSAIDYSAMEEDREKRWISERRNPTLGNSILAGNKIFDENASPNQILDSILQKQFLLANKKGKPIVEHMWTWKRSNGRREPSMPKRVRFSPWGGKRTGQMVLKPGSKGSKIIFSSSIPELTRIVSKRIDIAGFHLIPVYDKRHPVKILALTSKLNGRSVRDAMPFKNYLDDSKGFKPGHPYRDVNLKKDGKRKVKFSAWGGKRSPPIIGPIWTPTSQNMNEKNIRAILLLANTKEQENNEQTSAS